MTTYIDETNGTFLGFSNVENTNFAFSEYKTHDNKFKTIKDYKSFAFKETELQVSFTHPFQHYTPYLLINEVS